MPVREEPIQIVSKPLEIVDNKQITPPLIVDKIQEPTIENIFSSGQKIDWKGRLNAKIVVILHEKEFHNRFLTNGLRFFISDSKIDFGDVNFGIFKENKQAWQTDDMPHLIGILFSDVAVEKRLYKSKNKIIYVAKSLSTLALDTTFQDDLKQILAEIKEM